MKRLPATILENNFHDFYGLSRFEAVFSSDLEKAGCEAKGRFLFDRIFIYGAARAER